MLKLKKKSYSIFESSWVGIKTSVNDVFEGGELGGDEFLTEGDWKNEEFSLRELSSGRI